MNATEHPASKPIRVSSSSFLHQPTGETVRPRQPRRGLQELAKLGDQLVAPSGDSSTGTSSLRQSHQGRPANPYDTGLKSRLGEAYEDFPRPNVKMGATGMSLPDIRSGATFDLAKTRPDPTPSVFGEGPFFLSGTTRSLRSLAPSLPRSGRSAKTRKGRGHPNNPHPGEGPRYSRSPISIRMSTPGGDDADDGEPFELIA